MKVTLDIPSPKRLAALVAIGSGLIFASLAWATTFQSMTDAVQTFSNDKTFNGAITIASAGAYTGSLTVNGALTQTGATTTNGNETINGDSGVTGLQQATLGFEIGVPAGLDYLTDQGGIATFDGGVAIQDGTVEANRVTTLTFANRAAAGQ